MPDAIAVPLLHFLERRVFHLSDAVHVRLERLGNRIGARADRRQYGTVHPSRPRDPRPGAWHG